MKYVCGSFQIVSEREFRDYSDLDTFVTKSGTPGIMLGEDASDYMAFFGIEVRKPFSTDKYRIGVVLDDQRGGPILCPIHCRELLAIGMNNCVHFLNLESGTVAKRLDLGCTLHYVLCNDRFLAAVYELGAVVVRASDLKEVAEGKCDVVAEASLSQESLTLISMDEVTTEVNLTSVEKM